VCVRERERERESVHRIKNHFTKALGVPLIKKSWCVCVCTHTHTHTHKALPVHGAWYVCVCVCTDQDVLVCE
jgi:hypothetical protein